MILWKKSGNIEKEVCELDIYRLLLTAMWTKALVSTVSGRISLYDSGLYTVTEKYYYCENNTEKINVEKYSCREKIYMPGGESFAYRTEC